MSELKITEVSYEQFTDYDFMPPSSFFVKSAMGVFYFIHTADRAKAQAWVDEFFGKNRYTVVASKLQKNKGDITVRGTHCRKGQKR